MYHDQQGSTQNIILDQQLGVMQMGHLEQADHLHLVAMSQLPIHIELHTMITVVQGAQVTPTLQVQVVHYLQILLLARHLDQGTHLSIGILDLMVQVHHITLRIESQFQTI